MHINPLSFKGTFYTVSDSHGRLPMTAGVLTEVEKRANRSKEPVFLLDCGDFLGDIFSLEQQAEIYLNFHKNNPKINLIFNLGNVELEGKLMKKDVNGKDGADILKRFSKNGINIVNATAYSMFENSEEIKDFIKPYIIVEDIVNEQKKKILITGFTETKRKNQKEDNMASIKDILKNTIKPAIEKEKPDEILLMTHVNNEYVNEILDYAKDDLEIENIKFVSGGHPHSIEDFKHGETRVLYPAPCGKCAYEVQRTKNGFEFPKLDFESNRYNYNYAPLTKNPSVISNINISNPLAVSQVYQDTLDKKQELNKVVAKSQHTFKTRDEYNFEYSAPTQLGTFMANSIKEATNSDIGIMLTQDFREKLPQKGKAITFYNVCDVVNVDKEVYKIKNVTTEDLKNIFEISLAGQNEGEKNPNFLEYSSNLKIDRKITEDDNKVAQIYIKENNKWVELLDKDGKPKDTKKTFSIATCSYIANGGRPALAYFKNLAQKEPYGTLKTREMVIKSLKNLEKNPQKNYETSIMNNVYVIPAKHTAYLLY